MTLSEYQRQQKWDKRFLRMCREVSTWSKDPSTKVGAVIVRPDRSVASVGFNGFPKGMDDTPAHLDNREEKYSRVVHGEVNALIFAREPVRGYTLYTTPFLPCDRCAVQMLQAGIVRFVALAPTADQNERWGTALAKTQKYVQDCGAQFVLYSLEEVNEG